MLRCALPVRACASAPRPQQAERPAGERLASRRAALLAPPATLVAAAAPPAARAEAEALEQPLPLKVAKLGGILLAADLFTAAVLGKSVLGLLRPKPEGADGEEKDWKERLADRLLGSSAEPSSRPPPLADLPEPERATAAGVKLRPLSPASAAREALLARVRAAEPVGAFAEVLRVVDDAYAFSPVAFSTGVVDGRADPGQVDNMAGVNEGAAKVLAFAALHSLSKEQTLRLFAEHWAEVEAAPAGAGHKNVRAFARTGWEGTRFEAKPLTKRR